jgi:hypothetical protein
LARNYLKPEGYLAAEYLHYEGVLKDNNYNGHGILYWEGSCIKKFMGRFRNGSLHGRGIEYNMKGDKIYQGSWVYGTKHGRGIEYEDNIMVLATNRSFNFVRLLNSGQYEGLSR